MEKSTQGFEKSPKWCKITASGHMLWIVVTDIYLALFSVIKLRSDDDVLHCGMQCVVKVRANTLQKCRNFPNFLLHIIMLWQKALPFSATSKQYFMTSKFLWYCPLVPNWKCCARRLNLWSLNFDSTIQMGADINLKYFRGNIQTLARQEFFDTFYWVMMAECWKVFTRQVKRYFDITSKLKPI